MEPWSSCSSSSADSASADEQPKALESCFTSPRRLIWAFLHQDRSLPVCVRWTSIVYQMAMAAVVIALFIVDNTGDSMYNPSVVTTWGYWITELVLTVIWCTEYVLRLWCCVDGELGKYERCHQRFYEFLRPLMLLDLLSLISLFVDLSIKSNEYRGVSSLRILTIFRLERDFFLFDPLVSVIRSKGHLLLATMGFAGTVLLVGSVTMFYIESPVNQAFSSVLNSMWWCTAALTTVGYGDVVPVTGMGRVLGSLVAFLGLGIFGMPAGIIASGFQEQWEQSRRRKRRQRTAHGGYQISEAATPSMPTPGADSLPDAAAQFPPDTQQGSVLARLESLQADVAGLREDMSGLRADLKLLLAAQARAS